MRNSHKKTYKVVSLFSGCGGGDLGLTGGFSFLGKSYKRLPFEIVWANDFDSYAAKVYKNNLKVEINNEDIRKVKFESIRLDDTQADVLIAGFPCQDFSLTGPRNGLASQRGQLYKQIRRALRFFRPKLFLAENVPGIEYPPKLLATIKKGLQGRKYPKYRIEVFRVNAADYGVPQARKRILLVGIRSDMPDGFQAPRSYAESHWITTKDAIEDLWDPTGTNTSEVPDQDKLTHATIILGRPKRRDRILNSKSPAPTIRAQHHGHIEVHYNTQSNGTLRRLTVRECARLQSFPDSFTFLETASRSYVQVGNAMPPVMIYHWSRSIVKWLTALERNTRDTE